MGLLVLLEFIMIITLGLTWQFCQKSLSTADFKLQGKQLQNISRCTKNEFSTWDIRPHKINSENVSKLINKFYVIMIYDMDFEFDCNYM